MAVLEIFDGCTADILCVSWRYLKGVLEIYDGFLEIIYVFPRGI